MIGSRVRYPFAALALFLFPGPTRAADLGVTVPTVTAAPGGTVDVPITVSPGPNGLGVLGVQLRLDLGAGTVQSAVLVPGAGWIHYWGGPAVNANAGFVAVAAAGVSPVVSSDPVLATVRVTLRNDAVLGTDLPLTLSTMTFNEGTPGVDVTPGLLRVRTGSAGAPESASGGVALARPWPNPARSAVNASFSLSGTGAEITLDVLGVDGRRVRRLAGGFRPPGVQSVHWDLHDDAGVPVPAGLYFLRLASAGQTFARRVAVTR